LISWAGMLFIFDYCTGFGTDLGTGLMKRQGQFGSGGCLRAARPPGTLPGFFADGSRDHLVL